MKLLFKDPTRRREGNWPIESLKAGYSPVNGDVCLRVECLAGQNITLFTTPEEMVAIANTLLTCAGRMMAKPVDKLIDQAVTDSRIIASDA